jgi:hypothetical protein
MREKIVAAIKAFIESKHKLGERSGGSGHKGFVSYVIDEFEHENIDDAKIRLSFKYTITTETEFTYYPDNPPYEDKYEEVIMLDKDFKILEA